MRFVMALFVIFSTVGSCTPKPYTWSMESSPARGQRLVVFPPVIENAPDASVLTLQGALTGSIITHMGEDGAVVSSRVVWDSLAADFEGLPVLLFSATRDAFHANKREIEDREVPQKDTTLHRMLDALGDRMALAFRLQHLEIMAPSHLLMTGIRFEEPDAFSSRRVHVWAFVVDREKHRIALAVQLHLSAGNSLYRQAQGLLYAGRDIAKILKPWFMQLPPAPVVQVPVQQADTESTGLPGKYEDVPEQ